MASSQLLLSFAAAVPAALLSGVLTWAIRPLLVRIALARPNARSSHRIPTPQGAGIAVIAATLIAAVTVIAFAGAAEMKIPVAVFGATLFIAAVGFADDVNSIPVVPRLLLQGLAVAAVILAAPENLRIVPACPLWIERGLLLLAGLWFVNLVNFMDGLDLMTVAEIVPVTGALVLLGWLAELPAPATVAAAALFGAMLGFRAFQPAGGENLSRRRRQPADRPAGRLVPAAARLASADCSRAAVAALLSRRRDRHAVSADGTGASRSGRRIAPISTSAPPTTDFPYRAW